MARETSQTQTLRNKGPLFPPLLPVGRQESVLKAPKRGQFRASIRVTHCTLRTVCPRTDGIAAKLLWCGISSEALGRNLPPSHPPSTRQKYDQKPGKCIRRKIKGPTPTGIGATGLRGSERFQGLRGGLWEDPLYRRISHRMHLSEGSRHPLRAPLRVPLSSQSSRSCCPLSCHPLKLLQRVRNTKCSAKKRRRSTLVSHTILTQMMADEFTVRSQFLPYRNRIFEN